MKCLSDMGASLWTWSFSPLKHTWMCYQPNFKSFTCFKLTICLSCIGVPPLPCEVHSWRWSCLGRNQRSGSVNVKSCPDEWYHPLPVIRVAKWLSVDAQGQMGKGTGAALEKQFYVTSDEKCSIPFFSRFLSFFIQVTPSAVASAAGEGIVQRVLTEPRGALGKVLLASLDGTGIRVVSSFLDISWWGGQTGQNKREEWLVQAMPETSTYN